MGSHAATPIALAGALAATLGAIPARAEAPLDFEIAAKAGYLSNAGTVGVGGRLGYLFHGVYGGLSLVDYLPFGTLGANSVLAEAEVGYGFTASFLTLRPLLGVGFGISDRPTCPDTPAGQVVVCDLGGAFVLQPGGLVELTFGRLILGVDASALLQVGAGGGPALAVDGQVGARF